MVCRTFPIHIQHEESQTTKGGLSIPVMDRPQRLEPERLDLEHLELEHLELGFRRVVVRHRLPILLRHQDASHAT